MPWKFQTVGLRAASCNLKAEPKQLGSVWIRAFDEYQTQNTAGFCRLLVLPSQVLRLGSSKPDPGWSLGIAQGLERIRTDKAREPGPPKEDRVGSRKLGLP